MPNILQIAESILKQYGPTTALFLFIFGSLSYLFFYKYVPVQAEALNSALLAFRDELKSEREARVEQDEFHRKQLQDLGDNYKNIATSFQDMAFKMLAQVQEISASTNKELLVIIDQKLSVFGKKDV